jgi:excisionase family DNA binding protein
MSGKQFLSPAEFAELLGVSTKTVRRQIQAGKLPAWRFGGQWRIDAKALIQFASPSTAPADSQVTTDGEPPRTPQASDPPAGDKQATQTVPGRKPKWMKGPSK